MQPDLIPASMVERVKAALAEHHVGIESTKLPLSYGYTYRWACVCGESAVKDKLTEAESESRAHQASAILAAALEGCKVGVEEGVQLTWPAGKVRVTEEWDRDHLPVRRRSEVESGRARELVDAHRRGAAGLDNRVVATMLHRYVITTQPEPVERTET